MYHARNNVYACECVYVSLSLPPSPSPSPCYPLYLSPSPHLLLSGCGCVPLHTGL